MLHLHVSVKNGRLLAVQVRQRARDVESDAQPVAPLQRRRRRFTGQDGTAPQPRVERPPRAELQQQAAVRPVRREREQPAHVRMSHFAKRRILCFELLGVPVRRALRQPLDCDEEAEDLRPTYR